MGIDPGKTGALIVLNTKNSYFKVIEMPLNKEKMVDLNKIYEFIEQESPDKIMVERAMPLAMGAKHAFNYGRDFQTILHAVEGSFIPFELIEPAKWTKIMCSGIDANLKPKVRAEIALQRLYPKIYKQLPVGPKSGKVKDGPIDAILIAAYGLQRKD